MVRYSFVVKGRRSQRIMLVTTLVDPVEYPAEDIAQLYGLRWNVESDIRHIKQTLNIDHFSCKSPELADCVALSHDISQYAILDTMLKEVHTLTVLVYLFLCSTLVAQQEMLPGQVQRQSMSGGLIFRCLFDSLSDAEDSDGMPDYWTRKEGFDNGIPFPSHTVMENAMNPNPFGDYVFRMNMEGGAAAMFSPKIPIRAGMSYTVSAYVEASNLVFDEVSILAAFYGNDVTKPVRTIESKKVQNTNGWLQLSIGPIPADMPNVQSLSVGLLVMPTARQDYGVRVHFTNVEIWESPNISLEMANDHHLFFSPRDIDVRCQFRGLDPQRHSVEFILEDPFGRVIGLKEIEMMIGNHPAGRFVVGPHNTQNVIHGTATWKNMPILFPGFYRIRVATPESHIKALKLPTDQTFDDPLVHTKPLTFVVLSPDSYQPGGEFGWTLDGWSPEEITKALPTLAQSGLSHLKLPLWISEDTTPQYQETLLQLCKNLSSQQVHLIGLLNPVPEAIVSKVSHGLAINASSVMGSDPRLWGDSLQPTLNALSLLIKDWQWTSDTDTSLIDMFFDSEGNMSPTGTNRFQAYHKLFDQNQFGFGIGMTWNWYQEVPNEPLPIPNFSLNFPIDASIVPEDAAESLYEMSSLPFQRTVSVSPPPADDYALDVRIKNFVQSLVLLKATGVSTISLTAPKDEQTGILRNDGTPGELYLPWRTTATLLSGSRLLGSMTLPNRSRNYCFDRGGGRCVMVVWNDKATPDKSVLETLYLGNELDVIDVWGRDTVPEQIGNNQTIAVTQTPAFITGLNINAVRFRLNMQTAVNMISSKPNQTHEIPYSYRNDSAYPISVQITPEGPRKGDWTITPPSQSANLEAGATGEETFSLTLQPRADTGLRPFQYNVRITGIEPAEFVVYDEIMVGDPDVFMEFVSQLTPKGDIEVIQVFINNTDNVYTYDCRLVIENSSTRKSRVSRQGFGRVEYVYTIPRGQALLAAGVTEMVLFANPVNDPGGGVQGEPMVYTIPLITE